MFDLFDLFEFAVDGLIDFYLCRGNVGKWLTSRALDAATLICALLAIYCFKSSLILLGILLTAGAIWLFVVDCKFAIRLVREKQQEREKQK